MHSSRRVYVKTTSDSQNESISESTREEKYTSQHDASVAVVDQQQRQECERATPEYIPSYTKTHKYKYTTQRRNYSQGRTVICSSLTRCHLPIVPFPPLLFDVSRLPVIICVGSFTSWPVLRSELQGGKGGVASEVTCLFDLGLASDTDVHVDMTSTLGGDH